MFKIAFPVKFGLLQDSHFKMKFENHQIKKNENEMITNCRTVIKFSTFEFPMIDRRYTLSVIGSS